MGEAHRTAAVIPKMERIMSDWAHTCMPAKETVMKVTTVKINTAIIIVLAISRVISDRSSTARVLPPVGRGRMHRIKRENRNDLNSFQ